MNKLIKKAVAGFAAAALMFGSAGILPEGVFDGFNITASATNSGTCGDNLTWTFENGTLTISGTGGMYDFHEPDVYYSSYSPWSNLQVGDVVIDDGVTSIGNWAFRFNNDYYYGSFTSITIPESVTSIGNGAFCDCSSLQSITIPDSVTSIGDSAFAGCSGLYSITISDSVTSIGDSAFKGCSILTSIKIPNSVTSIRDYAFSNCRSLTSITIPDSVTAIGNYAFSGCSGLTSITIPDSVYSIGSGSFSGCSHLEEINVSPSNREYSSDNGVLFNKDMSEIINYPAGKTESTYIIPDSVTSIGNSAFSDCSNLTNITIPDSVTSIGSFAFSFCSSLSSITIPDSVTSIGNSAFSGCSNLTNITIPDSVTSIGNYAFSYCNSLSNAIIHGNDASIGHFAFSNCSNLTDIAISEGVIAIGDYAFQNCTYLKNISLPDSLTSIGNYAFIRCSSLISVTIPDSVTAIGKSAFYYCSKLTSVTIPGSVVAINDATFFYSNLKSLRIPEGVTLIGSNVLESSYVSIISIPNSVTSLAADAFCNAKNLKDIYYFGTSQQWRKLGVPTVATVHCFVPAEIADQEYTGSAIIPEITVSDGKKLLTEGVDYSVTFSDNVNIGTATATFTGLGNYSGTTTVTFRIVEPAPKKPVVSAVPGDTQVTLTWTAVDGASKYAAYCVDPTGATTILKSKITALTYTAKNLTNGAKYKFYVRAYADGQWTKFTEDDMVECTPRGAKPVVTAVPGNGEATLTWTAVDDATKYAAYCVDPSGTTKILNSKLTVLTYTAKKLTNGTKYKFYVRAYVNGAWSKFDETDMAECTPSAPSFYLTSNPAETQTASSGLIPVVTAVPGDSQATLTWTAVDDAARYAAYCVDSEGTTKCLASKLTDLTYTAKNLTNGTTYKFYVRAYANGKWTKFNDDDMVECTPASATPVVTATPGNKKVTLTWNAVPDAEKYAAYIVNNDESTTILASKIIDTTYIAKKLTNDQEYRFVVRAYVNGKWTKFTEKDIVSATPNE